jgi:hypothetical protein
LFFFPNPSPPLFLFLLPFLHHVISFLGFSITSRWPSVFKGLHGPAWSQSHSLLWSKWCQLRMVIAVNSKLCPILLIIHS